MKQSLRAATALAAFVRRGAAVPHRLLRRDRLRVALGPQSIGLAGYRHGLKSELVYREVVSVETGADASWQAAVKALPDALASFGKRRPAVTVVLSNHFVRYAILPWSAALNSEAEWLAYARHRFHAIHGAIADAWTIRIAPAWRQRPRIAGAIDGALLPALKEAVNVRGALVSVQPYLMTAYNRAQGALRQQTSWLVIEDPDRLTLALVDRGTWRALRTRRKESEWRIALPRMLDRESALLGLDAPCTEVAVCSYTPFEEETHGAYRLRRLGVSSDDTALHNPLAMALE
jgi:hypothetical protein